MIARIFRLLLGYTYVTRKIPRSFNEVHKSGCRYGLAITDKRYMTKIQAYTLIFESGGKRNYDGCKFCMPEMNSENIQSQKRSISKDA